MIKKHIFHLQETSIINKRPTSESIHEQYTSQIKSFNPILFPNFQLNIDFQIYPVWYYSRDSGFDCDSKLNNCFQIDIPKIDQFCLLTGDTTAVLNCNDNWQQQVTTIDKRRLTTRTDHNDWGITTLKNL